MNSPPILLNGGVVLRYAFVDSSVENTGVITVVVNGQPLSRVPCLAVCENLVEAGAFLMNCDPNWNVLGAGHYSTTEAAIEAAESAYGGIGAKWQRFRILTEEEAAHVERTRGQLRALALAYPSR